MDQLRASIERLIYCWRWRARYWWMDTPQGARAQRVLLLIFCAAVLVQWVRIGAGAAELQGLLFAAERPEGAVYAIYNWVVQLVIALALMAVSYILRPKVPPPDAQEFRAPVLEDGTLVQDVFGTVWIDDPFWLAHRMVGRDKIKTKGSKK